MSGHEVGLAVTVHVTDGHKPRLSRPQRGSAPPKATTSIPQQQRQGATRGHMLGLGDIARRTGGNDVEMTVVVEVAKGERLRAFADSKRRARGPIEGASPGAECDRHIVVCTVD